MPSQAQIDRWMRQEQASIMQREGIKSSNKGKLSSYADKAGKEKSQGKGRRRGGY